MVFVAAHVDRLTSIVTLLTEGIMTMEALWTWFAALSDDKKFDLLKIILEKVLLAAVVGIAGAIFAVLMERYKSTLKKQEELSKIMVPEIKSMLVDAELLFKAGVEAIQKFEQQALSCQAWAKALCSISARIESRDRYNDPEDLRREIVRFEGRLISPMELLERTAPNDSVRALLLNPMLATTPKENHFFDDFPSLLFTFLSQKPEDRDRKGFAILLGSKLFKPLDREPHDAYNEKANEFVLAMMRRLPTDNKAQEHTQEALFKDLKYMRGVIDTLPTALLVDLGQPPPYRQLAGVNKHRSGTPSYMRANLQI